MQLASKQAEAHQKYDSIGIAPMTQARIKSEQPLQHQFANNQISTRVWAIAGNSRQSGKSTITNAIGGLFAHYGHYVHMLNSDLDQDIMVGEEDDNEHAQQSIGKLFSRVGMEYLESLKFIMRNATGLSCLNQGPRWRHVLLDLNTHLTHENLDFFLIADYPVIVLKPTLDSLDELGVYLNACVFRIIEHTLPEQETKLNLLAESITKRRIPLHKIKLDYLFDQFDRPVRSMIKEALYDFNPKIILNCFMDPTTYSYMVNFIDSYYKPYVPNLSILGALPDDPGSVKMISALNYLYISSQSDPRLKSIAQYLAGRINNLMAKSDDQQRSNNLFVDDTFSIRQNTTFQKQMDIKSRLN